MSNKVLIDTKKEELINFYNNLLFENNHGCWILNINGFQSGHKLISKINNKLFFNYQIRFIVISYYPPIHFNDIENIKNYIDHKVNLFMQEIDLQIN